MDYMNLDSTLSALSANEAISGPGSLSVAVGTKLLDQSMELNEQMSDSMVKMMENSVNPNLGANIDIRI